MSHPTKEQELFVSIESRYQVDSDGVVWGPRGRVKTRTGSDGYQRFNVRSGGRHRVVRVHRLQAWQLFGAPMFGAGVVVRHLDNDKSNNAAGNLALGDASDNYYDRLRADREASAENAAARRRRLTVDDVRAIRAAAADPDGPTRSELAEQYGIGRSSIDKVVWRQTYRDV